jgi:hypothetical protein
MSVPSAARRAWPGCCAWRPARRQEIFGWTKTVGGGRKLRYVGLERNRAWALLTGAAYNPVRMSNLALAEG